MSHQQNLIDELLPTVKQHMSDNNLNYHDLEPELRNFESLPDSAKINISQFRILWGKDARAMTQWKLDGTLPRPDAYGKWTARQVRKILKEGI